MSRFHNLAISSGYLESQLQRYASEPEALPQEWRAALDVLDAYFPGVLASSAGTANANAPSDLIRRYAHLAAQLDPLNLMPPARWNRLRAAFEQRVAGAAGHATPSSQLLKVYAGHLAVETGHIDAADHVEWIHARREGQVELDTGTRKRALTALVKGETFERFMAQRFAGKKRFGAEGAEAIHPLIQRILDRAAADGIEEVIVGTMHRGRLGLMAALFGQPLEQLFCGMKGHYPFSVPGCSADVPYHMGVMSEYRAPSGTLRIRVLPNPSHLEAVNAVALGFARHRQDILGANRVLPLILHTDASVVAQGVVAEMLQLSATTGHQVCGSLNVVINNQLGFTTEPDEGRTSHHCTALWKSVDSLIAHVNGDDVDAVIDAADLAFDYRQTFASEAVIDLVCLRANGHNEVDEPRFTQPRYYDLAARRTTLSSRYAQMLIGATVVDSTYASSVADSYRTELDSAHAIAVAPPTPEPEAETTALATPASLDDIAQQASAIPADGQFNAKAVRLVGQRLDEWRSAVVSWATAEVLALGTVLSIGRDVRLTGQDVDRGAFSQRHLSLIDTATGERRRVFAASPEGWGKLQVFNTPLCEYAALSYEYGYSVAASSSYTIWEAQFGDFANVAQAAFDQFIATGAEKWRQHSGLIVLLPHGLEGQGPEHSSGRMERMIQLAANGNIRVAHPSTPANYYHLLVSQLYESPQRPLLVFTPKKLLRLKAATSAPADFRSAAGFHPLIVRKAATRPSRVLLCSGKIYYDLEAALAQSQREDVTLMRLERLYPFPATELVTALRATPGCEVIWIQEEPANFGLWTWLRGHLEAAMAGAANGCTVLSYLARPECPSPAGSFHADHDRVQARLVADALAHGTDTLRRTNT